jgi:glycerophosphoryl diester phosphodiesterase
VLDLATAAWTRHRRAVGIYPELKHPSYFAGLGPACTPLLERFASGGWDAQDLPLFIQCFEPSALEALRGKTRARLVQLIAAEGAPFDQPKTTFRAMTRPTGLAAVADYADGIGPDKSLILPRDAQGRWIGATALVGDAHEAGLLVHPWTFRSENEFLPVHLRRGEAPGARGDAAAEYAEFFGLGVDGVFSDHPADAVAIAATFAR